MQELQTFLTREFFLGAVIGGIIANVVAHLLIASSSRLKMAASGWKDVILSIALLHVLFVVFAALYCVVTGQYISGMPIEESGLGRFIIFWVTCWAPTFPIILSRQFRSLAAEVAWSCIVFINWLMFAYVVFFAPQKFEAAALFASFVLLNEMSVALWFLVTLGAAVLLPVGFRIVAVIKRAYLVTKQVLDSIS